VTLRASAHLSKRRALAAVLLALLGAGCSSMKATVDINAPPDAVWDVVSDLEHYHCWNPFFVRAAGKVEPGSELQLTMQPVGKSAQSFSPEVLEVAKGRRVVWRGRLVMPGLFDGRHTLAVEPLGANRSRFTQDESFSGVLVPFAGFEPYRAGWERMNAALKARVAGAYALAWETQTRVIDRDNARYEEVMHVTRHHQPFDRLTLWHHNYLPIQAVLFSRALYERHGGFAEDMDQLEDWNL